MGSMILISSGAGGNLLDAFDKYVGLVRWSKSNFWQGWPDCGLTNLDNTASKIGIVERDRGIGTTWSRRQELIVFVNP
jgi:hypothetical protein